MKTHTTLSIDPQLLAEAKKRNMNISNVLCDALKAAMDLQVVEDIEYQQICDRLESVQKSLKELRKEEQDLISKKVAYIDKEHRLWQENDVHKLEMGQAQTNAGTLKVIGR